MKTNSTPLYLAFIAVVFFSLLFTTASAQCVAPGMKFKNPVLISGTALQIGATYKFPAVVPGVDAIVKVTSKVNGATLTSIDDNTFGYSDAWQPVVKTPNTQSAAESYVSFKIDFVKSGDGSEHVFICFTLSAIDVDGDAVHVREMVAANDYFSYATSNATTLSLSHQGNLLKAVSTIANFPGIDTAAYVSNINYRYVSVSKISEVRLGAVTDATFTPQDRYSCIYFKPIVIPNVVVLPAQYLSLSTASSNKTIALNWQTNEKTDNSSFTIERSFDGSNFVPVNTMIEQTAGDNLLSYRAADIAPQITTDTYLYYRVKQTDESGKISYSNLTFVHLQMAAAEKMQTAPNPFTEKIAVQFNSDNKGNAEIRIANIAGVTLLSKTFTVNKGNNNYIVNNLAALTPGIYFARLVVNGQIIDTKKIIK
jgi:hypothetical protein